VNRDAIVIGAGTNGLAAAHLLARAGLRVIVLERRAAPPHGLDDGWVPPPVVAELGLAGRLTITRPDPWVSLALPDGGRLELSQDMARSVEAIRRISPHDAARWPEFCARMRRLGTVLEALYAQPAPDVETTEIGELLRLARLGLRVRRMGRQVIVDLLRVTPMSVEELLGEWFTHEALKAAVGIAGVMHLRQGPRSGGTAFNFLHHHVGCAPGVFRPPRSDAGAALAALPGVEVRRGATVARIRVEGGRACGVVLSGGETLDAPLVVSGADPRATLLGLLEPGRLEPEFALAVRNIKCRGVAARVTLEVDREPGFTTLTLAPSLTYVERAYDDAKYGRISTAPWVEARAEAGRIVAHVQYVPVETGDGGTGGQGDGTAALAATVVAMLGEHAPGLRGKVRSVEVTTPGDLQAREGLTGGHAYHGELTLDQVLFVRPVAGWSRYRTPVPGLWLCGSGTHPGGAIPGGAGRLAARAILEDTRR
jgi:phytoene dehydrogenase-like protein